MSKAAKKRECPAVGRTITALECASNRNSAYECPASCVFNPLAPVNYARLSEIETELDEKSIKWLADHAPDPFGFHSKLRRMLENESSLPFHSFIAGALFFERDNHGRTVAQGWEAAGFPGLKNDERVIFKARMQTRLTLLEVTRRLDEASTEVVDLLAPESAPFVIHDIGFASCALRFAPFLGWFFELPHFARLTGVAITIPDMELDPGEVLRCLVTHLGGPASGPDFETWMATHFQQIEDAIHATSRARRQAMFRGMDARYGKALYQLTAPFADCLLTLDALAEVDSNDLDEKELRDGALCARLWLAPEDAAPPGFSAGARAILGRVILGPTHWRLEAMSEARLKEFQARFEAALGHQTQLVAERIDDFGARMEALETFNPRLVPPALLENITELKLVSARLPAADPGQSQADLAARFTQENERAFPDLPLPALDGLTPRQAALDPAMRPKLVRLVKNRIQWTEEENRKKARHENLDWLPVELGLHEIPIGSLPPMP